MTRGWSQIELGDPDVLAWEDRLHLFTATRSCVVVDLYGQGADGVVFYESNMAVARSSLRQRMWRFGHPGLCRTPAES